MCLTSVQKKLKYSKVIKIQLCFFFHLFYSIDEIRRNASSVKSNTKFFEVVLPAFRSLRFLNTDTMTNRFPITSTTMVVIRTPARSVATQGKERCCCPEEPSSPAAVALRSRRVPAASVGSCSSRGISCARCLGSTSRTGSWSWRVPPCSIAHGGCARKVARSWRIRHGVILSLSHASLGRFKSTCGGSGRSGAVTSDLEERLPSEGASPPAGLTHDWRLLTNYFCVIFFLHPPPPPRHPL